MADMRKQLSYTAAEIDERLGAVPNKVDKVTGKGLSTNDYTNADKTAVGTIGDKVDKETGKGLSTNDYTTAEKNKLGGLSGEDMFLLGTALSTNDSLNTLTTPGKWYATSTAIATSITGIPDGLNAAFFGMTIPSVANSRYIQILIPNDDTGDWYKRRYTGSWQKWIKYTGTPMT